MPTAEHYIVCLNCREQHTVDRAVALAGGSEDPHDPMAGLFTDRQAADEHAEQSGHLLMLFPATKVLP